jgi:hypothetical protein
MAAGASGRNGGGVKRLGEILLLAADDISRICESAPVAG